MSDYGRLDVALVPSLPEQEAEAESQRLSGAANLPEPQQATTYNEPVDTTPGDKKVGVFGGKSQQIPSKPPSKEGASDVWEQHYFIHRVEETIDRGFSDFDSYDFTLTVGKPVRLLGLDDLRPRAELVCNALASGATVHIGTRDTINSDNPQTTGLHFTVLSQALTYRARQELWAVAVGGAATVGVTSYHSEPTSDTLATRSSSGEVEGIG